jgi:hypothetical protein
MSASCQCDICSAANCSLFDHLVGSDEQLVWNLEAECFGSLEVDGRLEFYRLLDRQVGGLFAFENPPSVAAAEAIGIDNARAVTDQPANVGKLAQKVDCRQRVARRQPDQLITPAYKKGIGANDHAVGALLNEARERRVDIAFAAGIQDQELDAECVRRSLDVSDLRFRSGVAGVLTLTAQEPKSSRRNPQRRCLSGSTPIEPREDHIPRSAWHRLESFSGGALLEAVSSSPSF